MRCSAILILFTALILASCAERLSEAERYQRNKASVHLSPRAKALLSAADVDQIAHLIARDTPKPLLAISKLSKREFPMGAWDVTVGYPEGTEHYQFGFYDITKENGEWRILNKCDGLSPSLVGLGWNDVPD